MLSSGTRKIFSGKYYAVVVPIAYTGPKVEKPNYYLEQPEELL